MTKLRGAGYLISEDSAGIFGDAANGERFGDALAAGDFDGDGNGGFDDLAIGVPREGDNGSVYVILGSQFGLIFANSVFWAPGALGIEPEAGARLGAAIAAGDFDGDGHDDLVIGDPEQDLGAAGEIPDAGLIVFAFGAPTGFDLSRSVLASDPEGSEAGDRFGWALAVGDFDGDSHADLVIGTPYYDVGGVAGDVGLQVVVYGSLFADGFEAGAMQNWSDSTP